MTVPVLGWQNGKEFCFDLKVVSSCLFKWNLEKHCSYHFIVLFLSPQIAMLDLKIIAVSNIVCGIVGEAEQVQLDA